ncbi:MAG: phage major tail tube protein [Aeromonadaceae bacterium]
MAKLPHVLTDMNVFIKEDSFAGQLNKMTMPDFVLKVVEKVTSGTAGAIERSLGRLEKLESEVSIEAFDPRLFELVGNPAGRDEMIILRGALDTGTEHEKLVVRMSGLWKSLNLGEFAPEKDVELKSMVAIEHFELEIEGREYIYVDKLTNIVRFNGVDMTKRIRACLGQ